MSKYMYPKEVQEFILDNLRDHGPKAMTAMINEHFGANYSESQIKAYYGNHHLNSGSTGHFPKGHVPYNKGKHICPAGCEKGWFKPGENHQCYNMQPIGTISLRSDGYYYKKISDDKTPNEKNWKQLHILIWEEAHGPVPEGSIITFKDLNHKNCSLDNLMLISRSDNAVMNKYNLRTSNPDYAETSVLLAKIHRELYRKKARK